MGKSKYTVEGLLMGRETLNLFYRPRSRVRTTLQITEGIEDKKKKEKLRFSKT